MDLTVLQFAITAAGIGVALLTWGRQRVRATRSLEEAVRECEIGRLEPGRFRVLGRIVACEVSPSPVDGVDCVYIEHAEYRTLGRGVLPVLREVTHEAVCHPFFLEDDTGRVRVDPARALIECASASADDGLTVERRLRAGEEVALTATFRPITTEGEDDAGPYRTSGRAFGPVSDEGGPPRLSHRTIENMVPMPLDDFSAFLAGAGAILVSMGAVLGFVSAFLI